MKFKRSRVWIVNQNKYIYFINKNVFFDPISGNILELKTFNYISGSNDKYEVCTEKKDKNKNYIYSGDILQNNINQFVIILKDLQFFAISSSGKIYNLRKFKIKTCIKIGNIREDFNILKESLKKFIYNMYVQNITINKN